MENNNTPLLLIVDDSRMSRMLIRAIVVDSRPHWRIIEATTGDEAVALANEHLPDFVSMDVNMPGISGLEAAGRIRIRHPDTRIPVSRYVRQIFRRVPAMRRKKSGCISFPNLLLPLRSVTPSVFSRAEWQ